MVGNIDIFKLYQSATGRRIFAMAEVRKRAIELAITIVAERAALGLAHDKLTMSLERQRRPETRNSHGQGAPAIDHQVDRGLGNIDHYLVLQIESFPVTHPRHQAALRLRRALFPQGVAAITGAHFVQEHVEVNELLERYARPEVARDAALLPDLGVLVERVRALNTEYGQALGSYVRAPSTAELRDARQKGQMYLLDTVVLILAHFINAPDDDAKRAYLLEPIIKQQHEIAKLRRRRRAPDDIDVDDDTDMDDLPVDDVPVDNAATLMPAGAPSRAAAGRRAASGDDGAQRA